MSLEEQIEFIEQEEERCDTVYNRLIQEFGERYILLFSGALLKEISAYRHILLSLRELKKQKDAKGKAVL